MKINLLISSIQFLEDEQKIDYCILSEEEKNLVIPSIVLDKSDNLLGKHKLFFESYTGLEYGWIEHKLLDIVQIEDMINIYYHSVLPIETKLENGFFVETSPFIYNPIVQKAIMYT